MEKFIPFEKLPKKKQRELNRARRGGWNGLNPVTRKPETRKAYNRRKAQKWSDDSGSVPFAVLTISSWVRKAGEITAKKSLISGCGV